MRLLPLLQIEDVLIRRLMPVGASDGGAVRKIGTSHPLGQADTIAKLLEVSHRLALALDLTRCTRRSSDKNSTPSTDESEKGNLDGVEGYWEVTVMPTHTACHRR